MSLTFYLFVALFLNFVLLWMNKFKVYEFFKFYGFFNKLMDKMFILEFKEKFGDPSLIQ